MNVFKVFKVFSIAPPLIASLNLKPIGETGGNTPTLMAGAHDSREYTSLLADPAANLVPIKKGARISRNAL